MLYLYVVRLGKDELNAYWLSCSVASLGIDTVLIQPVKICLNSRKAIKFGERAQPVY
jgi:hypothetical protein